jgi:two-component system cell cycle response regulator DivK
MAAVLQEVGVAIAEAGTGAGALERVALEPRPSLIMIDLSLPDCHGTEVVKALKADPALRRIPIVALSASVMASDKDAAAEAGCVAFIEKPVLPDGTDYWKLETENWELPELQPLRQRLPEQPALLRR